jgi:hypothetical protein
MALAFWKAAMYWHLTRKTIGLVILGVITVMLGQWLKGGLYAINPLIWFVIGSMDGLLARYEKERRLQAAPKGGSHTQGAQTHLAPHSLSNVT